ncbi:uncharacterized protein LOC134176202 [Corticium candelabrum]|uniref:uncharacterized protein LOC134176202 n=1 Tax=Corticium candelabrum TaxID=121492 RepID=UPI002E267198|nr:uncharacterized protein LOC134176202 [Corticium candelabrum]
MAAADPDDSSLTHVDSTDETDGYVPVAGNIDVFTSGVTVQDTHDVHDSLLFARLAASKRHNMKEAPRDWYGMFVAVLANVGWKMNNEQFQEFHQSSSSSSFIDFVSDTMREAATEEEATAISKRLRNMLSSPKKVKQFEDLISDGTNGHFEVTVASRQPTVGLTLLVNGYYFSLRTRGQHHSFQMRVQLSDLFFCTSTARLELNENVYATARQDIRKKLEKRERKIAKKKSKEKMEREPEEK